MEYTEFSNEKWRTRYLLIIYEAHDIYSREMASTAITEKLGTQPSGEMQSTAFTKDWRYPQHLLIRDGMASIYSQQMESTAFTHERWKTEHLIIRYGDHTF